MRKLLFSIMIVLCIQVQGQVGKKITTLPEATEATTGSLFMIRQGATGDVLKKITIANLSTSLVGLDITTLFSKLSPDTVQHTANYTVAASDWGKDQHCNKATSIVITLPPNLTEWPIGGEMDFWGEGAGIMVFKKGAGVVFTSYKDSIATGAKGGAVTVRKEAASKYFLVGTLLD